MKYNKLIASFLLIEFLYFLGGILPVYKAFFPNLWVLAFLFFLLFASIIGVYRDKLYGIFFLSFYSLFSLFFLFIGIIIAYPFVVLNFVSMGYLIKLKRSQQAKQKKLTTELDIKRFSVDSNKLFAIMLCFELLYLAVRNFFPEAYEFFLALLLYGLIFLILSIIGLYQNKRYGIVCFLFYAIPFSLLLFVDGFWAIPFAFLHLAIIISLLTKWIKKMFGNEHTTEKNIYVADEIPVKSSSVLSGDENFLVKNEIKIKARPIKVAKFSSVLLNIVVVYLIFLSLLVVTPHGGYTDDIVATIGFVLLSAVFSLYLLVNISTRRYGIFKYSFFPFLYSATIPFALLFLKSMDVARFDDGEGMILFILPLYAFATGLLCYVIYGIYYFIKIKYFSGAGELLVVEQKGKENQFMKESSVNASKEEKFYDSLYFVKKYTNILTVIYVLFLPVSPLLIFASMGLDNDNFFENLLQIDTVFLVFLLAPVIIFSRLLLWFCRPRYAFFSISFPLFQVVFWVIVIILSILQGIFTHVF